MQNEKLRSQSQEENEGQKTETQLKCSQDTCSCRNVALQEI